MSQDFIRSFNVKKEKIRLIYNPIMISDSIKDHSNNTFYYIYQTKYKQNHSMSY